MAPFSMYVGISLLYASVAGALVSFVEPLAAGSGIAEVKTYLNGIHIRGLLAVSIAVQQPPYLAPIRLLLGNLLFDWSHWSRGYGLLLLARHGMACTFSDKHAPHQNNKLDACAPSKSLYDCAGTDAGCKVDRCRILHSRWAHRGKGGPLCAWRGHRGRRHWLLRLAVRSSPLGNLPVTGNITDFSQAVILGFITLIERGDCQHLCGHRCV